MKTSVACMWFVAVLAGCSARNTTHDSVSTTMVTAATVEPAREPRVATFLDDDPALTRTIEASLAEDRQLSVDARNVNVSTSDGDAVALTGSVESYAARDRIAALVGSMVGKEHLYDHVQVLPLNDADRRESDENIAFSLQRSLVDQPRVTIDVVRGAVTLRGDASVPEQVLRVVERTPGVVAVSNELASLTPTR